MADENDPAGEARRLYESGLSYRAVSEAMGGSPSMSTVRRWAQAGDWEQEAAPGVVLPARATAEQVAEARRKASEVSRVKWAAEKDRIVGRCVAEIDALLDELRLPHVRREAKVLSGGQGAPQSVEVVDVELPEPSPSDKKALVVAAAVLVDKAQLLSGEATSRSDTVVDRQQAVERTRALRDELAERRAAAALGAG